MAEKSPLPEPVESCAMNTTSDHSESPMPGDVLRWRDADRAAVRAEISGNYCRCTGYQAIVDAIADVAAGEAP